AAIDLGELGGARDSELCARLEDTRHRDLDVAVGHDGGAEQLVERRVLENAPPSEIAERVALLRRVSPVRGHDDLGPPVIGSHRATGEQTHNNQHRCQASPGEAERYHDICPSSEKPSQDYTWIGAAMGAGNAGILL